MNNLITMFVLLLSTVVLVMFIFRIQSQYITLLVRLGGKKLLMPLAALFVPIHELSHLLVAVCCGHKIGKVAFFQNNGTGTLGFVEHSYKPSIISPFANLLIGIAPLAGGVASVIGLYYLMGLTVFSCINDLSPFFFVVQGQEVFNLFSFITSGHPCLSDNKFWLWLFLSVNVMVFAIPSNQDFIGAKAGLFVTAAALLSTSVLPIFEVVYQYISMSVSMIMLPALTMTLALFVPINIFLFMLVKLKERGK